MARFIEARTGEQKPEVFGVRGFSRVTTSGDEFLAREGRLMMLYDLHTPLPM